MAGDILKRPSDDLGRGLYVISAGPDGPCKVGVTNDLTLRVSMLQIGNWVKIRPVLFTFVIGSNIKRGLNMWSAFSNASLDLERRVHAKIKDLDLHLSGEWFDLGEVDCSAVIAKVAENEGYRLAGPEIFRSIQNYTAIPARQLAYIQAMVRAEESAQRAINAFRCGDDS